MTDSEKKKMIDERVLKIEKLLEGKYAQPFNVNGKKCFSANEKEFFMITGLSSFDAVVIEHAFSESEAKRNMFEDGDLFYMDELNETEMYEQMIEEIENQ